MPSNPQTTELACLDEEIVFKVAPGEGHLATVCFIEDFLEGCKQKAFAISQISVSIQASDCQLDLDSDILKQADWRSEIPFFQGDQITLQLKACVKAPGFLLRETVRESIDVLCWTARAVCTERKTDISTVTPKSQHHAE